MEKVNQRQRMARRGWAVPLALWFLAGPLGAVPPGGEGAAAGSPAKRQRLAVAKSFQDLPPEVLGQVGGFLRLPELASLACTGSRGSAAIRNAKAVDARQVKPENRMRLFIHLARDGAAVESLDLSCLRWLDGDWAQVLGELKNLKKLNLEGCAVVTDQALGHLPLGLEDLNLAGCHQITDAGMARLARMSKLKILGLSSCGQVSDAGLARLGHLPLEHLELDGCNITRHGLGHLPALSLRSLSLTLPSALRPAAEQEGKDPRLPALDGLGRLELVVTGPVTDQELDALLPSVEGLEQLAIYFPVRAAVPGQTLAWLRNKPLRSLRLTGVGDLDLAHLSGLRHLRQLVLGSGPLTGEGLAHLKEVPLEHLFLDDAPGLRDDALNRGLAALGNLKGLTLHGDDQPDGLNEEFLASLPKEALRHLAELDLGPYQSITDSNLAHLKGLPLRSLTLHSEQKDFTDAGLAALAGMPLEKLDLWVRGLTGAGFAALADAPLAWLHVDNHEGLEDVALEHLKALPHLSYLKLEGRNRFTAAGLAHLGAMRSLRHLDLEILKSHDTDAAWAGLQALPLVSLDCTLREGDD